MNAETAKRLREPFAPDQVGLLPRIWCSACRGQQQRNSSCPDHTRRVCKGCRSRITEAHLHLSYVGHAHVTERLLAVDPSWHWEPVSFDADGLPRMDGNGGLWIRLHVADRPPMIGYGDADGKKGGDAVKIAIGDAVRNAAMRLGVALDLWKKEREGDGDPVGRPSRPDTHTDSSERDGLLRSILAIARRKGLPDKTAVADDFAHWCTGRYLIKDAPTAVLASYLSELKNRPNGGGDTP